MSDCIQFHFCTIGWKPGLKIATENLRVLPAITKWKLLLEGSVTFKVYKYKPVIVHVRRVRSEEGLQGEQLINYKIRRWSFLLLKCFCCQQDLLQ